MKRTAAIFLILSGTIVGFFLRELWPKKPAAAKVVTIKSRNFQFKVATRAETVEEVLAEQSTEPSTSEREASRRVAHGMVIDLKEPLNITFTDAGRPRQLQTQAETVGDLLNVEKIGLARTDQVMPPLETYLAEGLAITIDRIVDLEVAEIHDIPYEINLLPDPETYYGREIAVIPGKLGRKEQQFVITYKNGVEIKRRLLKEKVLAKAVAEQRKFGTKIEIEEVREGRASWYSFKNCMCAAHPFYELGRYVKVTNLASGKSIIVKINDRGPDLAIHPDRAIDLDASAFKELAPLGTGTAAVRVELLK